MSKSTALKKYHFTLKNIDTNEIDTKYKLITPQPQPLEQTEVFPENITTIDELYSSNTQTSHSYIDENRKYCVSMLDSVSKKSIQKSFCFWCRHSFHTVPIGCPIRYVCNKVAQIHISEITKEKYIICHKVSRNVFNNYPADEKNRLIENDYYETDGCFCSFNCCFAFINDNVHSGIYANSKYLLMKMYSEVFKDSKLSNINPSPHWRLLKDYGGFMTIKEYKVSMRNFVYIDIEQIISKIPSQIPVGHVFEESIIF